MFVQLCDGRVNNMKLKLSELRNIINEVSKQRSTGFYWVRLDGGDLTVGLYEGLMNSDGSMNTMPWSIVGSDEIFKENEIEVITAIPKPAV